MSYKTLSINGKEIKSLSLDGKQIWHKESPTPPVVETEPFWIDGGNHGYYVYLYYVGNPDYIDFEYSYDKMTWNDDISRGSGFIRICATGLKKVYIRNKNNNGTFSKSQSDFYYFSIGNSQPISVGGNIMSLLYKDFEDKFEIQNGFCFYWLFRFARTTTAPKLPATKLAAGCYNSMFAKALITEPPVLPATKMEESCYDSMFADCSMLSAAPELKSTQLAASCYRSMLSGCTSIKTPPELKSTSLASNCYQRMFAGCTSLSVAPELPAMQLADSCYYSMLSATAITTPPALPATKLERACYATMFRKCTSLTAAPVLPATELTAYCCQYMFHQCTSIVSIDVNFSDWSPTNATTNWFANTGTGTADRTFRCPSALPQTRGISKIPTGWTIQTK